MFENICGQCGVLLAPPNIHNIILRCLNSQPFSVVKICATNKYRGHIYLHSRTHTVSVICCWGTWNCIFSFIKNVKKQKYTEHIHSVIVGSLSPVVLLLNRDLRPVCAL